MPQYPERRVDVADLLRVRLDKTQQDNVTADEYQREMRRRAEQSRSYAQEQRKLHPTKPPAERKPESFLETYPKVPGKVADAIGGLMPESVSNAKIPSWLLPVPPGTSVGEATRGMVDTALPIDTSNDATLTSQAVRAALLGMPAGKLVSKAASVIQKKAIEAFKNVGRNIKSVDNKLIGTMRKATGIKPPVAPKPKPSPFGELLNIDAAPIAQSAAQGVARGLSKATPEKQRGFISSTVRNPWFWMTGGSSAALGLGRSMLDTAAGVGSLANQALNTPSELPSGAPPEPPAPAKDAPIKQEDFDGRKLFGPKGEVPGNDERGNAVTKPTVPAGAEDAPSLAAQHLFNNDSDFNAVKTEYLALKNKLRVLQDRRIQPKLGLSASDIERWNELNSNEFKTPAGVSIFEGR